MPAIRFGIAAIILLILPGLTQAQQAPAPDAVPTAAAPVANPVAAGTQTSAAADSGAQANYVIADTIIKLRLRNRIAARVDQTVDMLNQKFELKGFYFKDTNNRLRLQLDLVGIGDSQSTMLQVCDGKVLWEYQKVLGMKNYRKRDIVSILKKLEDPVLDNDFRTQVMASLGFGGPEALLSGFQAAIGFNQYSVQTVEGVPSFVLGGTWKNREGLFGPTDRVPAPTAPLPPYIPSNVQVFIDVANAWPYRIEMIGVAPSLISEDTREVDPITKRPIGKARPAPKVDPSNISLRYTLLPDSEIKPDEQFVFNTPRDSSNLTDETEAFLTALDGAIKAKTEEKQAKEAASEAAGEPPIKTPVVDLPSPAPGEVAPITPPPAPK